MKLITGGVICFWGGVWALGAIFMLVLMAKNYCIKSAAAGRDIDWAGSKTSHFQIQIVPAGNRNG